MGFSLPDPERSDLYGIQFTRPREVWPIGLTLPDPKRSGQYRVEVSTPKRGLAYMG